MTRTASGGGRALPSALPALLALFAPFALASGSPSRIGLLARRRAGTSSTEAVAQPPLAPQPNDTITADYWMMVDSAIRAAGQTTSRQPTLNDLPATPTPLPWEQVMHASQQVEVVDTPAMASGMNDWERGTPLPPDAAAAQGMTQHQHTAPSARSVAVLPYDMFLGASIMYDISVHNTEMPPPSQNAVNEQFVAQCPMVMFSDQIHVRAPRCGGSLGEWVDPDTERTIMRWQPNGGGGLRFGVDSVVTGNGSVAFASFKESFSLSSWFFELRNCLEVMRYNIEEQVIKVDHMAPGSHTTATDHSQRENGKAIFYKYIIRHPNGTTAAETDMFRMGQDQVNVSLPAREGERAGRQVAAATRQGRWKDSGWRECHTSTKRGWAMGFPASARGMETVATVQDLRVASAAVITLMAFRDEEAGVDGFQHVGQGDVYYELVCTAFSVFGVFVLLSIVMLIIDRKGIDKKLRRHFFRLESALLPRCPTAVREPVLRPAY